MEPRERVFLGREAIGKAKFAILAEAMKELELNEWGRQNYNGALTVVINRAVEALPDDEGPGPEYSDLSWQEIGLLLYGFKDAERAEEIGMSKAYNNRHQLVRDRSLHGSKATHNRRIFKPFFDLFADKFASLQPTITDSPWRSNSPAVTADTRLVWRDEYIDAIRRLVNAGRMIICIWGEAGTGKTTLAGQAAKMLAGGAALALRAADDRILSDDILDALVDEGIDPYSYDPSARRHKLKTLLAGRPRSGALVVDGVTGSDALRQIIPNTPAIPVLVTSRVPLDDAIAHVEIGDFTKEEAATLIRSCLDEIEESEIRALGEVLGHRPLAVDQAVRFIRSADLQVQDVVADLTAQTTTTLDHLASPHDQSRNLALLYRTVLDQFASKPTLCRLLDCFLAAAGRHGAAAKELIWAFVRSTSGELARPTLFHRSLQILAEYGLIREDKRYLAMHPLTSQILRELRTPTVLRIQGEFMEFLLGPHVEFVDDPYSERRWPWRFRQELVATADLLDGWKHVLCIDRGTWAAVRELPDLAGATHLTNVRYEVFDHGIYHLNEAGGRVFVEPDEAHQFHRVVKLYNSAIDARDIVHSSDEDAVGLLASMTTNRAALTLLFVWDTLGTSERVARLLSLLSSDGRSDIVHLMRQLLRGRDLWTSSTRPRFGSITATDVVSLLGTSGNEG